MTDVPLREHFETRLSNLEKKVDKSETGILDRLNRVEGQVDSLRWKWAWVAGAVAVTSTVVGIVVMVVMRLTG